MKDRDTNYTVIYRKKVAIINLGCKVNKYESDAMAEKLQEVGMTVVEPEEYADVYIVNTCSVTNMAQRKSRQMLRRAKKNNPGAVVIAAGCYVNAEHEELLKESFVDVLVGNNRKNEIAQVVAECFSDEGEQDYYLDINQTKEYEEMGCLNVEVMNHQRAYIKIQDGCNQFCSYCIIPYTRGRVRSRNPKQIIAEIEKLARDGIKEFVLTGIHISSYGVDFGEQGVEVSLKDAIVIRNLGDLLYAIEQLPMVERIRLGSLEPRIITKAFLERVGKSDKLCPHFHLSLQSACNETLRRMNRKYTIEEFMEKCNLLREWFEQPAITTDVIVGFPGETEEEFATTVANLEELNLYEIHVFKYSVRSGTVAQKMPNQVIEQIKNERSDILLAMTARQKQAYEEGQRGKQAEVLVEEMVREGVYTGHTKRYIKVELSSDYNVVNEIVRVTL
ncbi:MAG: tRNA (N(6)-L-threonylcarbamoyladenosine(37)-C(2))-methylthiotransferase MtaB [Lachnospiraceae bacterium]|nr:tRNA (N(6)-L-threonylcarbamoyladenosine(37)-C(2))-methylthiotransferase MtaB [Lachnospiraceae bacterium]